MCSLEKEKENMPYLLFNGDLKKGEVLTASHPTGYRMEGSAKEYNLARAEQNPHFYSVALVGQRHIILAVSTWENGKWKHELMKGSV
jgi:hypothetical protein